MDCGTVEKRVEMRAYLFPPSKAHTLPSAEHRPSGRLGS